MVLRKHPVAPTAGLRNGVSLATCPSGSLTQGSVASGDIHHLEELRPLELRSGTQPPLDFGTVADLTNSRPRHDTDMFSANPTHLSATIAFRIRPWHPTATLWVAFTSVLDRMFRRCAR